MKIAFIALASAVSAIPMKSFSELFPDSLDSTDTTFLAPPALSNKENIGEQADESLELLDLQSELISKISKPLSPNSKASFAVVCFVSCLVVFIFLVFERTAQYSQGGFR